MDDAVGTPGRGRMRRTVRRAMVPPLVVALIALFAFVGFVPGARSAHATSNIFVINNLGDAPDANTADGLCQTATGDCTLRAAIQQADADPAGSADEIDFGVPGQVTLTSALPMLTNSMFITGTTSKNTISRGDGAATYRIFDITNGAAVSIENLIVRNGIVGGAAGQLDSCGGGIRVSSRATLDLSHSSVAANQATTGGGICVWLGTATISDSAIAGNLAKGGTGGGIDIDDLGVVRITDSSIETNQAADGGGVFQQHSSQLFASGDTFLDNASNGTSSLDYHGGGAIFSFVTASAQILNSTFTGNGATGVGGAIYSTLYSGFTIVSSTVAANNATDGGGMRVEAGTVENTIVARDTATIFPDLDAPGVTSAGHNLVGDGTGAPGFVNGTNGDKVGTAIVPIDPLFEVDPDNNVYLKDNGGPTNTIALRPGSPAIDAGSDTVVGSPYDLTTDQRGAGFPRLQGAHVDIGAFETAPK